MWVRSPGWDNALEEDRNGIPIPVFLPGGSHGQGSLAGYSPQGCNESDTTEATQHMHTAFKRVDLILQYLDSTKQEDKRIIFQIENLMMASAEFSQPCDITNHQ